VRNKRFFQREIIENTILSFEETEETLRVVYQITVQHIVFYLQDNKETSRELAEH
jgi:hypothetical protein